MAFTPTGVQFVAQGLSGYLSNLSRADKAQRGLGTSADSIGGSFLSLGGAITGLGVTAAKVAVGGVAALGVALTGFAVTGIKKAANLEQQMVDIASVMGKTKEEVQPLKELIGELALDPNLKVSSTEAANAVELLARNGLEMSEILGGAAKSTVALANATKADFGVAADIATDVMSVFNIEADNMTRAVDGITGVITNSKLDINDYALALGSVGAVAEGMGLSLEDMNAVLAATASSFSSGRVAGTSLKVLLQRLAKPTDEMQKAMNEFGISLFDNEGQMRDMAEVAQQLNKVFQGTIEITSEVGGLTEDQREELKRLQGIYDRTLLSIQDYQTGVKGANLTDEKRLKRLSELNAQLEATRKQLEPLKAIQGELITTTRELTDAEKAELAATLGGADGARQIIALSKLTADEFRKLSDKVNESGQAFKAAATRVDSLQGAMAIFRSVVEAIQVQVGDKFLPLLRKITVAFTDLAFQVGPKVADFFGEMANSISGIIERGQELFNTFQTSGIAGLAESLGLSDQTEELVSKIISTITELANLITSTLMPALENVTTSGILDIINASIEFLNENFEAFKGAILGVGAALAGAAIAAIIAGIVAAISAIASPVVAIIGLAALLGAAWSQNWLGIRDITAQVGELVMAVFEAIRAVVVNQILPSLQTAIGDLTEAMGKLGIEWSDVLDALLAATVIVFAAIGAAIVTVIAVITSVVAAIASGVATMISWWERLGTDVGTIFEGIITAITGAKNIIVGIISGDLTQVMDGLVMVWEGNIKTITGLFWLIVDAIGATLDTAGTIVATFVGSIIGFFTVLKDTLVGNSIIPDMINTIISLFKGLVGPVTNALSSIADLVGGIFSGLTGGVIDIDVGGIGTGIINARTEASKFNEVLEKTIDILNRLKQALGSAFDRAVLKFRKKVIPVLEKVQETFTEFVKDIQKFQSEILPELTKAFQEFGADVARVFDEMRSDLDELLDAIVQFGNDAQDVFDRLRQAMDDAAAAVRRIASDLSAMAGSLAAISSQIDTVVSKLNQLDNVSLNDIRNQIQALENDIEGASADAGTLRDRVAQLAGISLNSLRGSVQGLTGDLSSARSAADLALQSFDALAQADFGNFSTLSNQIRSALPDFENLAVVSGLAASNLFGIANSGGSLQNILDLLNDIIQAAKDAKDAINDIPSPPPTSLSLQSELAVQANLIPASLSPITVSFGPITINDTVDMAIFEQQITQTISDVLR